MRRMSRLALLMIIAVSGLLLGANAEGAYDYAGTGLDPINATLGFDRGYIYFAVFVLSFLVILGLMASCFAFACMYRIHHKRAMSRMWRTNPNIRSVTELISTPEKTQEPLPPPYQPTEIEIPPSYYKTPPNHV